MAMTTRAETFERVQQPLAERGIEVGHVQTSERLIPLTGKEGTFDRFDVGFVYPSRLMEGAVADATLEIPWVNGLQDVLLSRNKAGVIARLDNAGVPVPETVLVSNPLEREAVQAAAEEIGYPVVIKPNSTTRGIGVAKATDPDSLGGVVDYLDLVHDYRATGDKSFLLQEYISQPRDLRVMVLDGVVVGAVERRLPAEALTADRWKHNVHRGAVAEGVELPTKTRQLVERVADVLEIDFLGVDLLVTENRTVVSETNARPTIDDSRKYAEGFYDRLASLIKQTSLEDPKPDDGQSTYSGDR